MGAKLMARLGRLDMSDLVLSEGKHLARRAPRLIEESAVGYALIRAMRG